MWCLCDKVQQNKNPWQSLHRSKSLFCMVKHNQDQDLHKLKLLLLFFPALSRPFPTLCYNGQNYFFCQSEIAAIGRAHKCPFKVNKSFCISILKKSLSVSNQAWGEHKSSGYSHSITNTCSACIC